MACLGYNGAKFTYELLRSRGADSQGQWWQQHAEIQGDGPVKSQNMGGMLWLEEPVLEFWLSRDWWSCSGMVQKYDMKAEN